MKRKYKILIIFLFAIAGVYLFTLIKNYSSAPDIQFALEDTYKSGQSVEVKITNSGIVSYMFNPRYEACYISYFDSSGRQFAIPPGTHCDILGIGIINPGEIKTLFEWNLDECIVDQWGCVESKPLSPGIYTIRGTFDSVIGTETLAKKTITIIE